MPTTANRWLAGLPDHIKDLVEWLEEDDERGGGRRSSLSGTLSGGGLPSQSGISHALEEDASAGGVSEARLFLVSSALNSPVAPERRRPPSSAEDHRVMRRVLATRRVGDEEGESQEFEAIRTLILDKQLTRNDVRAYLGLEPAGNETLSEFDDVFAPSTRRGDDEGEDESEEADIRGAIRELIVSKRLTRAEVARLLGGTPTPSEMEPYDDAFAPPSTVAGGDAAAWTERIALRSLTAERHLQQGSGGSGSWDDLLSGDEDEDGGGGGGDDDSDGDGNGLRPHVKRALPPPPRREPSPPRRGYHGAASPPRRREPSSSPPQRAQHRANKGYASVPLSPHDDSGDETSDLTTSTERRQRSASKTNKPLVASKKKDRPPPKRQPRPPERGRRRPSPYYRSERSFTSGDSVREALKKTTKDPARRDETSGAHRQQPRRASPAARKDDFRKRRQQDDAHRGDDCCCRFECCPHECGLLWRAPCELWCCLKETRLCGESGGCIEQIVLNSCATVGLVLQVVLALTAKLLMFPLSCLVCADGEAPLLAYAFAAANMVALRYVATLPPPLLRPRSTATAFLLLPRLLRPHRC